MEALHPPSAAAPALRAQMAPERRAALKRATSLIPARAAGTLCGSDGGGETVRTKDNPVIA